MQYPTEMRPCVANVTFRMKMHAQIWCIHKCYSCLNFRKVGRSPKSVKLGSPERGGYFNSGLVKTVSPTAHLTPQRRNQPEPERRTRFVGKRTTCAPKNVAQILLQHKNYSSIKITPAHKLLRHNDPNSACTGIKIAPTHRPTKCICTNITPAQKILQHKNYFDTNIAAYIESNDKFCVSGGKVIYI